MQSAWFSASVDVSVRFRSQVSRANKYHQFVTDSLLIVGRPPESATGAFGKLKDEIEADFPGCGAYVSSYCSIGAKSVILTIHDEKGLLLETRKRMKGIIISSRVDAILTKERFRALAEEARRLGVGATGRGNDETEQGPRPQLRVNQIVFKKNYLKLSVRTLDILKIIQFTSNKQRILYDTSVLLSVPYGTTSD